MNKERFNRRNKVAEIPKLWVRLTWACNNNCIFCLDKESQNASCVDLEEIKSQLRQGRKQKIKKLILSGGEPSLHPDYLKIIRFAHNIGYEQIQTITNGRMFAYKKFLEEAIANGLTETTFSMHGHTKELYEKQSQIKGSFEEALLGLLNALKTKKIIVNIDIVINKINYRYLEGIIRFFINLGVSEFDLLQIVPFGSAWKNRHQTFYDIRAATPYLKKGFALQKEFPNIYLWANRLWPTYLEGFEELIQHPIKLRDEIRGRKEILEDFIHKDKPMYCDDGRCPYCFLYNFCRDLKEIKKRGILQSKPYPVCLNFRQPPSRTFSWRNFNLDRFLNFFIKHRYFVKSLRCARCRDNKNCAGMQIDYIREHGFKELKPIKN